MSIYDKIFGNKPVPPAAQPVAPAAPSGPDWSDPKSKVSKYFTVHDCTHLPSWDAYHLPSEEEKANLVSMAQKMDVVRDFLGRPINVHVWIRPSKANIPGNKHHGQDYNALVSGAPHSAHIVGRGVDYDCGDNCDLTRGKLLPKLAEFGLCMEDKPGSTWVHNDDMPPRGGTTRFFKP